MDFREQRRRAEKFVAAWEGRGYEKGETHSFWRDLLGRVLGIEDLSTNCRFEQRTSTGGFIDVVIPEARTIVEQKSWGVDLDKAEPRQGEAVTPYQQAKRYADSLPNSQRPDRIIVCNFASFRIHDLNRTDPEHDFVAFDLAELPQQLALLSFLVDPSNSRASRECQVSMQAGKLVGLLYEALRAQYLNPNNLDSAHALNVLCVRLVFCLFAEDTGVFDKDSLWTYLHRLPAASWRGALEDLFRILDTPLPQRDPYEASGPLGEFPYVNGGLFHSKIEIPNITEEIRTLFLEKISRQTDWSGISPTIFGGVFESTLNPETRRAGGMHYTSPENIHKLIDPLFLNELKSELAEILTTPSTARVRQNALRRYQDKLASLTFLDPAAGSGNFLTETYISLRRLENRVIHELTKGQVAADFGLGDSPVKVSLSQFYAIEINDFAVEVARAALWIAQLQANREAETILNRIVQDLPLQDAAKVVQGNALSLDWNQVLPAKNCCYILGNPPFIGYSNLSAPQKADRALIFSKSGGVLDYVACWYAKAADYMEGNTKIRAAFVSTNSITQGQQVQPLFQPLFQRGISISFAYTSFVWGNEASDQAHVHVVIIGFAFKPTPPRGFIFVAPRTPGSLKTPVALNRVYMQRKRKNLCPHRVLPAR